MNFTTSLATIGLLLTVMVVISIIETWIPLRARGEWSRRHLGPNLALTFVTFATNLVLNIPLLRGLVWLQSKGWGVFNAYGFPPILEFGGAILALDLAWYVTHVSMHKI